MKNFLLVFFTMLSTSVFSQIWIDGLETTWDNNFTQWRVFSDELEGELHMTWLGTNKASDWRYEVSNQSGTIKRKWRDDPTQWEIRGNDGTIVTARGLQSERLLNWTITNDVETYQLQGDLNKNEWMFKSPKGDIVIHTHWSNNFSVWVVEDDLAHVDFHIKMMAVFLAVFHSAFAP